MKVSALSAFCVSWVLASLGGCVNLSRTIEPERIFPVPSDTVDVSRLPKDGNGQVCAKEKGLLDNGKIPSELTQFSVAMFCAYQQPSDGVDFQFWMRRFVDKGLSLSDHTCEDFFDQLESRRVEASYSQTNFNVAGTAVTAVLAAADHHARAVFNLAMLLTAGNAWFENYKSNYILTPQLRKLHDLIQINLRDPIGIQIRAKSKTNGYGSFDEAKQDVRKYDALCSHKVIQDIVTESVAKAELTTFVSGPDPEKLAKADATKKELYAEATPPGTGGEFASGEFEALYVIASIPDHNERVKAATALGQLLPQVSNYIVKLGLDKVTPVPTSIPKFQYVGELLGFESVEKINELRRQIDEQITKNARAPAATPIPAVDAKTARAFQATLRGLPSESGQPINFGWKIRDRRNESPAPLR